jgi:hypothetical protein
MASLSGKRYGTFEGAVVVVKFQRFGDLGGRLGQYTQCGGERRNSCRLLDAEGWPAQLDGLYHTGIRRAGLIISGERLPHADAL